MIHKKNFLILYCIFSIHFIKAFDIYEYHTHIWNEKNLVVPLEYVAYKLLKNRPLKNNIGFFTAPWTYLLKNPNFDNMKTNISLKNGFTICSHFDYKRIIPLLKSAGVYTLFTPHADCTMYDGVKIVPFPHLAVNGSIPKEKNIFYSFVGYVSDPLRNKIFNIKHPKSAVIIKRHGWHFYKSELIKQKEKIEYQDILSKSIFSLCPKGNGSGTLRFWESLQAGAIPVLIADDLLLPIGFDWDSCIIKVKEKNINNIPHVLSQIPTSKQVPMRNLCLKAFELFSGENLVRTIRLYYQ